MTYYNHDERVLIQVQTSKNIPALIFRARQITGHPSNAAYLRDLICRGLEADLGVSYSELMAQQPNPLYSVKYEKVN